MLTGGRCGSGSAPRARAGFTLIEISVALVLVALLSGVIMTQVVGRTTQGQAAALAENLSTLGDAAVAFRADVGRYPSRLTHLSEPIPPGATDPCARPIPAGSAAAWRGPYVGRRISAAGLATGNATIADAVRRDPPSASVSFGMLYIDAAGVDPDVAETIDRAIDGVVDFAAGSVRWQGAAGGILSYGVPVRGC